MENSNSGLVFVKISDRDCFYYFVSFSDFFTFGYDLADNMKQYIGSPTSATSFRFVGPSPGIYYDLLL